MNRCRAVLTVSAFAIATLTVWVHWPSVHNEFLHWDDEPYLEKAIEVQPPSIAAARWAFTTIYYGNYLPLTWLSYIVDWRIWGRNAAGHHATSVVLHGLNAGLAVLFGWMLLKVVMTLPVGQQLAAAAAVGLVFGIHPLQVESVAWIGQRKTVLCSFFSLASLCAYLWYTQRPQARGRLWAATALFVAALLSKPMAVSLPVVMLVMDFYPLRRHQTAGWLSLLKEKVLLLALTVPTCIVTIIAQHQAGALRGVDQLGVFDRLLVAARSIMFYISKALWPIWLSPFYPLEERIEPWRLELVLPATACFLITGLLVWRRKHAPGPLAAWLTFLALVAPVSGIVQVGSQAAADRFMYLAIVPLVMVVTCCCVWLWRRLKVSGRSALLVLLSFEMVFLALRTREQIAVWRDDETLWKAAWTHFPDSSMVNHQIGAALSRRHRFDEALPFAYRSVVISPSFPHARATLGLVYLKKRRYAEAAAELENALRLNPLLSAARYNLACAYSRLGRIEDAYDTLSELLAVVPRYSLLAVRDNELAALRQDAEYGPRLHALLTGARDKSSP